MDSGQTDRQEWIRMLRRIAEPVLRTGAAGQLHQQMPVEHAANMQDRHEVSPLEAVARLTAGIAPWLELGGGKDDESNLRAELADLTRQMIAHAVDPESPDFCNYTHPQALVDTAFLAQGLLRAPNQLWGRLGTLTQRHAIEAMHSTRAILPGANNWLLFSAEIEAFLRSIGEPHDQIRIDYALRMHDAWYKGDGHYGDGAFFHADYYNAFVIHPMLLDIATAMGDWPERGNWMLLRQRIIDRAVRYAVIQERMISPEGTLPPIGRSLAYRTGALHALGQIALLKRLPEGLKAAQVRCGMTAVLKRMLDAPGTFDEAGWLRIGLCGHQPSLGERYISTGSLYLCSVVFLPLGLSPNDPFWSDPFTPWTSLRIYERHEDLSVDCAMADQ